MTGILCKILGASLQVYLRARGREQELPTARPKKIESFFAYNFTTIAAASAVILLFPDSMNRFLMRARERVLTALGDTL